VPHILKPAFEQFRHELLTGGRPMLEKNIVPIQSAILDSLDQFSDMLVEKSRRLPHPEAMIEISAKWLGLASEQDEVIRLLKTEWEDTILGATQASFVTLRQDEKVILLFAGIYEESRYLTGRLSITF
jgi:hypothetical protein